MHPMRERFNVDLVSTVTEDGVLVEGALLPSTSKPTLDLDAILCLPGVGGNFYASTMLRELTPAFSKLGLAVLWANTRGHDGMNTVITTGRRKRQGAAYEIVGECTHDITAWLNLLTELGLKRVAIFGHSLGAIKTLYAAAHAPHPAMHRLLAVSPPRLSYQAFRRGEGKAAFLASMELAEHQVQEGKPLALIEATFPFPLVISAATYVDKYGPAERYNFTHFLDKIMTPTGFIFGESELKTGVAFANLPSVVEETNDRELFDVSIIPAADHFYTGRRNALAEIACGWLAATS